MSAITIIDYGMGNLRSVQKAIERVGADAKITCDPKEIAAADKVILPGVGAFRDAIQALHDHHLVVVIRESTASGRPFLGICLGLQLLFELSYEDGEFEGLGIVPGKVRRFDLSPEFKIPHMGWNAAAPTDPTDPFWNGIPPNPHFYFVHSYFPVPDDGAIIGCTTEYGERFASGIIRGNTVATQFHPEKSQALGLRLLENFFVRTEQALATL